MNDMNSSPRQRQWSGEASRLRFETEKALQPLHDDLQELTPTFDGIVYFAVDRWHANNSSAVVAVQPESDDTERFLFYNQHVKNHRVDHDASAYGLALQMDEPALLKSRQNPTKHVTLTRREIIDDTIAGGLQAAYNRDYGHVPNDATDARIINKIMSSHSRVIHEVAGEFNELSNNTPSIGDTLELLAPATPNGYIVSWDLDGSTQRAKGHYGILRNYLIDAKNMFDAETASLKTHIHDTGDGQDITFWLPDGVDRASVSSVRRFGEKTILPLLDHLSAKHRELVQGENEDTGYTDLDPKIHFAVGLGYIEQDKRDERTSQEYWDVATLHKDSITLETTFTENALRVLGPLLDN